MPNRLNAPIGDIDLRNSAILLDVDGTVLDIAPTPNAVTVPAELRGVLERLRAETGGAVAFVSGRPIADLDAIFAPMRFPCIGGHGAELRLADGSLVRFADKLPVALVRRLADLADEATGILVENKGYSVAVHYRLAPERGTEIANAVANICKEFAQQPLQILPGKSVVEVKAVAVNKGTGVRELMKYPPFAGRRPVFIGDDVTDEPAFAAVAEQGGIGLSVGRDIEGAAGRFDGPADVREWLGRIATRQVAQ